MLADPEVFRRFLATVGNHLVAHLGALIEVAEPSLLDSRDVDEHVLTARVGLNKSETLRWIEPLHSTCATSAGAIRHRHRNRAAGPITSACLLGRGSPGSACSRPWRRRQASTFLARAALLAG